MKSLKNLWEPVNILEPIEKKRFFALDLFRGFVLLLLPFWNFGAYLLPYEVVNESVVFRAINSLIWIDQTYVVFVVMAGVYMVYAQPSTRRLITRGIQMIVFGFFFNVINFFPLIFNDLRGVWDVAKFPAFNNLGDIIFSVHTIIFVGISLLIFALIRKIVGASIRPVYFLLMALIIILAEPFVSRLMTGNIYIDRFLGYMWGSGGHVLFPIFPSFAFLLVGALLGCFLLKHNSPHDMEKVLTYSAVSVFLLGILLVDFLYEPLKHLYMNVNVQIRWYFYTSLEVGIKAMGLILCWQALFMWLYKLVPTNFIFNTLIFWSKHIIIFFIWVSLVFGWTTTFFYPDFQATAIDALIYIPLNIILAHLLTLLTVKLRGSKSMKPAPDGPKKNDLS